VERKVLELMGTQLLGGVARFKLYRDEPQVWPCSHELDLRHRGKVLHHNHHHHHHQLQKEKHLRLKLAPRWLVRAKVNRTIQRQ
jgi:ABC-type nickel/cobalt efflux system permease component RcnA